MTIQDAFYVTGIIAFALISFMSLLWFVIIIYSILKIRSLVRKIFTFLEIGIYSIYGLKDSLNKYFK